MEWGGGEKKRKIRGVIDGWGSMHVQWTGNGWVLACIGWGGDKGPGKGREIKAWDLGYAGGGPTALAGPIPEIPPRSLTSFSFPLLAAFASPLAPPRLRVYTLSHPRAWTQLEATGSLVRLLYRFSYKTDTCELMARTGFFYKKNKFFIFW